MTSERLATIDPSTYARHPLHEDDQVWPETNCYVDLWVEVLHALGLNPVAGLAFTLSADFDGEQWEFFKYPPEDLRSLYGIEVHEVNIWRPLEEHISDHHALGHLLTIEADSWFLPDTAGVSYRLGHQKSTIVPARIDRANKTLTYFHNRGCHLLSGDDYDGVLQVGARPGVLPPYAELVSLDGIEAPDEVVLRRRTGDLVNTHLARRPKSNPVERMAERIVADVEWLRTQDADMFHGYAFGTLRQCGAWAQTVAAFVAWLHGDPDGVSDGDLDESVRAFGQLSETAKSCQFKLARAAAGRTSDLSGPLASMAAAWERGYGALEERCHGRT